MARFCFFWNLEKFFVIHMIISQSFTRKVTLRSVWHLYITADQYGNRLYTVANVYQIFRNRRYTKISSNNYQKYFCNVFTSFQWHVKDWILKKQTKVYSRSLIENISEFFFILSSAFTLIIRIMISPKNFGKIAILKIWWLVFFWVVKTYFGILPLKWCIFRHEKKYFNY